MTVAQTYEGLRVLDLSTNIAGPFAAMILGDFGADVIKVERMPTGDDTRALPPRWGSEATVFFAVNRNKRSVALDLRSEADRRALMALAKDADVVIESFPPGLAQKLSLTFEDFQKANPDIILKTITAFGEGPLGSTKPGYDALVQAVSGMMSLTGNPGEPTVRIGPSVLDLTTGMWSAIAIMGALERRRKGNSGEHLYSSLIDSAMTLMCHQILGFLATGEQPQKFGSNAPSAAPYGVFSASDGDIMIATASEPQFPRLCKVLGLEWMVADPQFAKMSARLENRDRLNAEIAKIIATDTVDGWLARLEKEGISVGRVEDLAGALNTPVARERALFVDPKRLGWDDGLAQLRLPFDPAGEGVRLPPPKFGEHTDAILGAGAAAWKPRPR